MSLDNTGTGASMERCRLCTVLGGIIAGLSAVFCVIVLFADVIFSWSGLKTFYLALYPSLFVFLFSLIALIRSRFAAGVLREEEEKQLLERRKSAVNSILDVSEDVRFSAKRQLDNFDKYLPSAVAVLSFILGGLILYFYWRSLNMPEMGEAGSELLKVGVPRSPVNLAFLCFICSVFAFFSGVFTVGQSHTQEFRWLRPAGSMLILAGVVFFLTASGALLYVYGKPEVEPYFAKILSIFEAALAVEFIISFAIEFYRPRSREEIRPVYESRILSLFTEPGGVVRNIAASLDYQFGFNISKTSVYRFFGRVFLPSVLLWGLLLWIFTLIGEVGPGEMGIRERFGKAVGADLGPGFHLKAPWPFERIVRVPVNELQCVVIGRAEPKEGEEVPDSGVILWTGLHFTKEEPFLVASGMLDPAEGAGEKRSFSVALLETAMPIYYRVRRTEIRKYAFGVNDIQEVLRAIGRAEATAFFASTDFFADISTGREDVCNQLRQRIQNRCDGMEMGIEIVEVNMIDAHPPIGKAKSKKKQKDAFDTDVAEAFQLPVIAAEEAKTAISAAESYHAEQETLEKVGVNNILSEAEVEKRRTIALAKADAEMLDVQSRAYYAQPQLFQLRTYLDFLTKDCSTLRKFIVSKELYHRIYEFNFEEKAKLDLMEDPEFSKIGK